MAAKTESLGPLRRMLVWSLMMHVGLFLLLHAAGVLSSQLVPKPQAVMTARLVRLGTPADKKQLPTLQKSSAVNKAPPSVRPSAAAVTQNKAATAAPVPQPLARGDDAAGHAARTRSTLARLRKQMAGEKDGDAQGDAEDARGGDAYIALVERCVKSHFVIEGTDPTLVLNRSAQVLVRIGASGKVVDARLSKTSGLQAFDNAVMRAVRQCAQVPPPPTERREQLRRAGIEFTFRP